MKIREFFIKSHNILKNDGIAGYLKKIIHVIKFRWRVKFGGLVDKNYCDVLFVNGCALPHPSRYRVSHQIEQLRSNNFSAEEIFYTDLSLNDIKRYRCFVFFRCPVTGIIEEFIPMAKSENKRVFFDIDDLVIDKKYTSKIKYLENLDNDELELYDDGVSRMQKTLKMCDCAITSTNRLAEELKKYVPEVFINRNVASEEMVKLSLEALEKAENQTDRVVLGYFSGSITHNDDFELILPAIVRIMEENPNIYLKIVGLLDVPEELKPFQNRILSAKFTDWKSLPKLICSVDINLAPLQNNIFNEAKSENKWVEAALCKVITVASNIGAFKDCIEDEEDGILCNDNEWYEKLNSIIRDEKLRNRIAENAFKRVKTKNITTYTGKAITDFIESKLSPNICFVLPSVSTSGGVNVAIRHCNILKKQGYDVLIINQGSQEDDIVTKEGKISVISAVTTRIIANINSCIGTLWSTMYLIRCFEKVKNIGYLVQNFETDFYENGSKFRQMANSTYSLNNVKYLTISKWCKSWLENDFKRTVSFAPNGINLGQFPFKNRDFSGKIKVLVEGNSKDYYKNVDESFKIVEKLDKSKFEIHYLSYAGKPKNWYCVDKFYNNIPYEEVGKIYKNCDILLKSSLLESFSYPPLEMMATGGVCVVVPNGGNVEYLKDNFNCMFYAQGNIDEAVDIINRLAVDSKLRDNLVTNGYETAKARSWSNIEKDILELYRGSNED